MNDAKERLRKLIVSKAVETSEEGFTLASGLRSNLYIDLRKITQDPLGINLIGNLVLNKIEEIAPITDAVGGLETGSIPIATAVSLLSLKRNKPIAAFWVRKRQKDHGTQKKIEGNLLKGSSVVILEDTVTTGGSSLLAVESVREFGAKVVHAVAVVDRGGSQAFLRSGVPFFAFFSEADIAN